MHDRKDLHVTTATALTRRRFVSTSMAAAGLPLFVPARVLASTLEDVRALEAIQAEADLLGAGKPVSGLWTFGGSVPAPVLRVRQGETLAVRLVNRLAQSTTIHWHGIRIENAMDGVPHMTQAPVGPGESFDYRFRVPDAGTFWYHPHERSYEQVARGMAGVLIVEEPDPPAVDQDLVVAISDWRLSAEGLLKEDFGSPHDRSHAGRLGNRITVNGAINPEFPVMTNERIRLRLANIASARVLKLRVEGVAARLIAVDGQPVSPTIAYEEDGITLGPGNRADVIIDMLGEPGRRLALVDVADKRRELATFVYHASRRARAEPLAAPIALPANPVPEPDHSNALDAELVMTGGAASESDHTMFPNPDAIWSMNGRSGMHGDPLFGVALGRTVQLRIVNDTAWPHAMHLHGHHFRVLSRSGSRKLRPFWWDTVLMDPREEMTIAFVADNPGKWMLHCHMLDHQAAGMDTWFDVTA